MADMDYLTPDDIARKTGKCARWVVRKLLSTGELPSLRLGRSWLVRPCDYEAWEARRIRAATHPVLIEVPPYRSGRKARHGA